LFLQLLQLLQLFNGNSKVAISAASFVRFFLWDTEKREPCIFSFTSSKDFEMCKKKV